MRILLINDYTTPLGGVEITMRLASADLRMRGHDVRIFGSDAGVNGTSFADHLCYGTNRRWQAATSVLNLSARTRLSRILQQFRPEIVHLHMFLWQLSPMILGLLRNFPTLYHIHMFKPICPTGLKVLPTGERCLSPPGRICLQKGCLTPQSWVANMAQRALFRNGLGSIDSFVTPSNFMKARLESNGISPTVVVPNGCPVTESRPNLQNPPVIGFAGRLTPEKGVANLLKAVKSISSEIPEIRLVLVGDGPQRDELERHISETGLRPNVETFGTLSRDETELVLRNAWVQVVPSLWEEPFGNVAIEAMMRGTAVVCSDDGGLPEIVRHNESGILVQAGDDEQLATTLLRLLQQRELCEEMGAHGRRIALKNYTVQHHVDGLITQYDKLIQ